MVVHGEAVTPADPHAVAAVTPAARTVVVEATVEGAAAMPVEVASAEAAPAHPAALRPRQAAVITNLPSAQPSSSTAALVSEQAVQ